jgi:uncharacterized membrane protein YjfL (UPF0719 family)
MTIIFARHRQTVVQWATSGGIGLATAVTYFNHFIQAQVSRPFDQAILLSYLICLYAGLIYLLVFRVILPLLRPFSRRTQIAWGALAVAVGAFLSAVIPTASPTTVSATSGLRTLLSFGADTISLGLLVFGASAWLATRPVQIEEVHAGRWAWLWYSVPCVVIWTVYLLAFWPGLMSPDSLEQWRHIVQGQFNNDHPAFHTLTTWLITRVWIVPALLFAGRPCDPAEAGNLTGIYGAPDAGRARAQQ